MTDQDVVYFNNCNNFDHAATYGEGAFFDLGVTGSQAKMAVNLPIGQVCVVASNPKGRQVVFGWYALTSEEVLRNEETESRVFFGTLLSTQTLAKAKATQMKRYAAFFNVNGHFKRPSVLVAQVAERNLPPTKRIVDTYCVEEVTSADGPFIEGATRRIRINAYERNAKARTACIQHYGTACSICKMDFGSEYGPDAEGYIHVHHLKPLSKLKKSYKINPVRDLRPVCPNCHAVLHLGGVTRSIKDVQAMLNS
jgi:hypothetical protein